jgi:hypothetical protein
MGAGSYLAWLSNGVQTESAIVQSTADLTYIAPQNNNQTLWDRGSTLLSGNYPYVPIAPATNLVWSGLNADGTDSGQNCSNWMSDNALLNGSFGDPGTNNNNWSYEGLLACNPYVGFSIYCFETPS